MSIRPDRPCVPNWLTDTLNDLRQQMINCHSASMELGVNLEHDETLRRQGVYDIVQIAEKIEMLLQQTQQLFLRAASMELFGRSSGRRVN